MSPNPNGTISWALDVIGSNKGIRLPHWPKYWLANGYQVDDYGRVEFFIIRSGGSRTMLLQFDDMISTQWISVDIPSTE